MSTQTPHIAIVDDDPALLKALARLLQSHSYNTKAYESARAFIDSLRHDVPECLIVDLQMPEMTGLDLQHQLTRDGIKIPTIVVTAHDEGGARQRCQTAGALAYLLKPVQAATLIAAIEAVTSPATTTKKYASGSCL
jgi:FixJ family two-component response regulator